MRYPIGAIAALLALSPLLIAQPVKAETDELKNPSWKEVPGTLNPEAHEEFRNPAFIDMNRITRRNGILTYDLVNTDSSHSRLETNCKTQMFRAVRHGDFASKTRVSYLSLTEAWQKPAYSNQKAIVNFVCNLPKRPF